MSDSHRFTILSINAPTVLPRVALMFTRRGVAIEQLALATDDDGVRARLDVSARCASPDAHRLGAQLRRIVEVLEVEVGLDAAMPSAASA